MNGLGVGSMVGLGTVIGNFLIHNYLLIEVTASFLVYGFLAGLLFELYKLAFRGARFPPRRGQR